jgi:hypothetical protein
MADLVNFAAVPAVASAVVTNPTDLAEAKPPVPLL